MAPNTDFTRAQAIPADATFDASTLAGKSVVLTGGASGIGEQYLRALVAVGAFVTFGDIANDLGTILSSEFEGKVAFVPCDVLKWRDQLALFKTALEKSPSKTIDIVIANAGVSGTDSVFEQAETDDGEPIEPNLDILQVNLMGVVYTVKLALFYLPKQRTAGNRDRCIILTGSMASYLDYAGGPQYNAAKMGLRALMKSIRQSGPSQGIRINMLAPWFVATRIRAPQASEQLLNGGAPFCEGEDCGAALLHLASDHSINGRTLGVVPRSNHPRGYYDLERDDWNEDDYMTAWQNAGRPRKRVGS
ncbi:5'-hydroxyaverantin dehydrogenase [Cercospora beticola]|uniref:5'-hydroxyaverantin dehydrogenase n=1 Tax=Cercospora beticola TaxID=122368 RepID=A0A2G5HKE9_CERBT|nr:5'-hydroxyaverantin dehydrogenase [Cercospora beticola]PIA93036.1 5'-hydroxyaverantin dehydrogenase [Cercospora beticola]WPB01561.1 hypothetical protein RHO25_006189 [Cercospora beticola]